VVKFREGWTVFDASEFHPEGFRAQRDGEVIVIRDSSTRARLGGMPLPGAMRGCGGALKSAYGPLYKPGETRYEILRNGRVVARAGAAKEAIQKALDMVGGD